MLVMPPAYRDPDTVLWLAQPVHLSEGKPYTMSAWVKSEAPGIVSLIGGGDWQFRVQARATGGQWHRIAKTFTPGQKDCDFTLRINTESVTPGGTRGSAPFWL